MAMMRWILDVKCIALSIVCMTSDPMPQFEREFSSRPQCLQAVDDLNKRWRPATGAWSINCVLRVSA